MKTTITIWIRKADIEKFIALEKNLEGIQHEGYIMQYNSIHGVDVFTEKMMGDFLQLNISLELFGTLMLRK